MNNLEDLVPPMMLCVKIPSGAFEDSALVWWGACVYPRLYPDGVRYDTLWNKKGTTPAPTFQEIMQSFDRDKAYLPNAYRINGKWQVDVEDGLDANVWSLIIFPVIGMTCLTVCLIALVVRFIYDLFKEK